MKEKRVAILTLYYKNYNYGGQLQAYALWRAINKSGYKCDQISFKRNRKKILGRKIRALIKTTFHDKLELFWIHFHARMPKTIEQKNTIMNNYIKFDAFMDGISHTEIVNSETTKQLNDSYDCFVVGSDQVWNPEFVPMDFFFDFVEDNKAKMSYAASIRISSFEKNEAKIISKLLNRFDYISVREENSKVLLQEIGVKKDIDVVLDPTMLLDRSEWDDIAVFPSIGEKYIVTYLVRDKRSLKQIRAFAQKNNYKVVSICEPSFVNNGDGVFIYINGGIGPYEFLGLIKNAEYVFPNSFHGTVFSIIFNKQFYVYGDLTTDQRKRTLLEGFGLLDRAIEYNCNLLDMNMELINYEKINTLLCDKRVFELKQLNNKLESIFKNF